MPHNIEIKAHVADRSGLEARVAGLAGTAPELILQDDTFFNCPSGRLKLRVFSATHAELIHYHRPDLPGPKPSDYRITPSSDPAGLREVLERAWGVLGRVVKRRTLYLIGQTRVHLDSVTDLGEFLELEVVLRADQSQQEGVAIASGLVEQLGIGRSDLIESAYLDLLQREHAGSRVS